MRINRLTTNWKKHHLAKNDLIKCNGLITHTYPCKMPLYEPPIEKKSHRLHDHLCNGWVNDDCMVKACPTLKLQILYTIKIVEIKLWPPLAHVKDTKPCWLASTCLAYFETYCFNMFSKGHYKVCRKSFNKVWWPQCGHITWWIKVNSSLRKFICIS